MVAHGFPHYEIENSTFVSIKERERHLGLTLDTFSELTRPDESIEFDITDVGHIVRMPTWIEGIAVNRDIAVFDVALSPRGRKFRYHLVLDRKETNWRHGVITTYVEHGTCYFAIDELDLHDLPDDTPDDFLETVDDLCDYLRICFLTRSLDRN